MKRITLLSLLLLVFAGCSSDSDSSSPTGTPDAGTETDGGNGPLAPDDELTPAVSDLDSIFDGVPANSELPEEGKFDADYPAQFDLVATQSPVRSQASRGVCSIFSTVALMEHLYIQDGTITDPDFSEQFLQWSAKVEVGRFTNTSGSNAQVNLESLNRYGTVLESDHPYETRPWGTAQDEACTGDDRPVRCYTNGDPPQSALDARRWTLPRGRYVRSDADSIKAYMTSNDTAVVAGLRFFYQSWNHGASDLPTNREYFSEGYVLYPNERDRELSEENPAGHSILLVGWDDELTVPMLDENGEQVLDDNGEPVTETGFFLFKNSWGTGGFGLRNPFGAGYGWISMRYVEEYGTVYSSTVPEVNLDAEVCDDGTDNDLDGDADCADSDCETDASCNPAVLTFSSEQSVEIPDNDAGGAQSVIEIDQPGSITYARVSVDIEHTYRGDLEVALIAPNGRTVLRARTGGSENNIVESYEPSELVGQPLAGTWTLEVIDNAQADTGSIRGWSMEVLVDAEAIAEICDDEIDNDADGATDCADDDCLEADACAEATTITAESNDPLAIPDNDPEGDFSLIEVSETGTIASLAVDVDITHPYRADLVVELVHESGVSVLLHDQEGGSEDNLIRRYEPTEFNGLEAAGIWSLEVSDRGNLDEGTLNRWALEILVR